MGQHINEISAISSDEKIVGSILVNNFDTDNREVVIVSAKGNIKRVSLKDLQLQRISKTSSCMNLKGNDKVVAIALVEDNKQVALLTKQGYGVRFMIDEIPNQGAKATGVKGIKLDEYDEVAGMASCSGLSSQYLTIVSDKGVKRISSSLFPIYSRGAKGRNSRY